MFRGNQFALGLCGSDAMMQNCVISHEHGFCVQCVCVCEYESKRARGERIYDSETTISVCVSTGKEVHLLALF